MRILRKMQESMSYERRYDGQLEKKKEWNRVHSVHGMREKLPKERTLKDKKKGPPYNAALELETH
jgi:hypothetical protein